MYVIQSVWLGIATGVCLVVWGAGRRGGIRTRRVPLSVACRPHFASRERRGCEHSPVWTLVCCSLSTHSWQNICQEEASTHTCILSFCGKRTHPPVAVGGCVSVVVAPLPCVGASRPAGGWQWVCYCGYYMYGMRWLIFPPTCRLAGGPPHVRKWMVRAWRRSAPCAPTTSPAFCSTAHDGHPPNSRIQGRLAPVSNRLQLESARRTARAHRRTQIGSGFSFASITVLLRLVPTCAHDPNRGTSHGACGKGE